MVTYSQDVVPFRVEKYPEKGLEMPNQKIYYDCFSVMESIQGWYELQNYLENTATKNPDKLESVNEEKRVLNRIESLLTDHLSNCSMITCESPNKAVNQNLENLNRHHFLLSNILKCTENLIYSLLEQYSKITFPKNRRRDFTEKDIRSLWRLKLSKYDRDILDNELILLDYLREQIKNIDTILAHKKRMN